MWSIRLSDPQREALRMLLVAQGELGPSLSAALESLELARWDDLPEAELPWESVSVLAELQGIGEADVVWDLACGLSTPLSFVGRGRSSVGR
ncbi:MAG: hypothetical protein NVSMB25_22530 [Thermoleophilaceae bacterium]